MSTTTDAFTAALEAARDAAITELTRQVRTRIPAAVAVQIDIEDEDLPGHQITFIGAVRLAGGRVLHTDPGGLPWDDGCDFAGEDRHLIADAADWDPDNDPADEFHQWVEEFRDDTREWPTSLVDTFRYADGAWIDLDGPSVNTADPVDGDGDGPVERRAVEFGIEHLPDGTIESLIDQAGVTSDVIDGVHIRNAAAHGITLRVHEGFAADWDPDGTGAIDWDAVLAALVADADYSALLGPIRAAVEGGFDVVMFVQDGPRPPAPNTGRITGIATGRMVHGPVAERVVADLAGAVGSEVPGGLTVVADDRAARRFDGGEPQSVWLAPTGPVDPDAIGDGNFRNVVGNAAARFADLIEVSNLEQHRTSTYMDATVVFTAADRRLIDNRSGRCIFDGVWIDGGDPSGADPMYLTVDGPSVSEAMRLLAGEGAYGLLAVTALARANEATTVRVVAIGWNDAVGSVARWAESMAPSQTAGVVGGIGSVTLEVTGGVARLVGFTEADGRRWVSGPPTDGLAEAFVGSDARLLVQMASNGAAWDLPAGSRGEFVVTTAGTWEAGTKAGLRADGPMWRIACRDGLTDGNGLVFWSDEDGWGTDDGTWATRYTDAQKAAGDLPLPDGDGPVWWVPDAPTGRQHTKAVDDLAAMGVSRRLAGRIITQGIYDRAPDPVAAADAVAARTRSQRR
ncbi:hypothetical protein DVS28_b0202 (plasmid) [Euzebya pacifica]|uniref:Uncharacterized protein n=1 Tax=Euzebya pacifica TaxID=1608957 RepID=A0A346Y675_9ACTN|nr:hypothetical protein [Euzebya pacifica]AXV09972.1 hypothetical protein DVS28_b0202 [Euzebya pacifica]